MVFYVGVYMLLMMFLVLPLPERCSIACFLPLFSYLFFLENKP